MEPPADAAPSPMELKQHGRSAKNLKHKSKSKRPTAGSSDSPGGSNDSSGLPGDSAASGDAKSHAHAHHHHHHVNHRHGRGSSAGAGTSVVKGEGAMRELLTSKIAELQVGGDENLETPIDLSGMNDCRLRYGTTLFSMALCNAAGLLKSVLSVYAARMCLVGIYSDETLPAQTVAAMKSVLESADLSADEKASALSAQVQQAVREFVYWAEEMHSYVLTLACSPL